jgi:hypothetical protein
MPENGGTRRPALSQLLRIMAGPTKANQTASREAQAAANRPARASLAARRPQLLQETVRQSRFSKAAPRAERENERLLAA